MIIARLVFMTSVLTLTAVWPTFAQDFSMSTEGIRQVRIVSETTVIVRAHERAEVVIPESENQRRPNRSASTELRRVRSGKEDNTDFGVNASEVASVLVLTGLDDRTAGDLVVYLPESMDVSVEVLENNDIVVSGFSSAVDAKTYNGDITLAGVTGPVIAENNVGDIRISFSALAQNVPMSVMATNGDVDVSLPATAQARLTVSTPRGELLTDMSLDVQDVEIPGSQGRNTVEALLNAGGVHITLRTLKGNVHVRRM